MIDWTYDRVQSLKPRDKAALKTYFYPARDGKWMSPSDQAELIMEWGKLFLGDESLETHNHLSKPFGEVHRRLITDLGRDDRFYYITFPSGMGKCVFEDTEIVLSTGERKKIKNIKSGDTIFSLTADHKCEKDTVEFLWERGKKHCLRLTTESGRDIESTYEHRFYTPHGWKHAYELSKGDLVATPRKIEFDSNNTIDINVSKFLIYMVLAGCISGNNCTFTSKNKALLADFFSTCNALNIKYKKCSADSCDWELSNGACELLRSYDMHEKTAKTKRFPHYIYRLPKEQKYELFNVILGTNGHVTKNGDVSIHLTTKALVDDIYYFMLSLGIVGQIHKKSRTTQLLLEHKKLGALADNDIYWTKVKSITYTGKKQTYDIQTVKNKNFVANGMFVHNTTIVCLLYPLFRIYNRLDPFICVGGANQKLSEEEHLNTIKFEIEDNPKIIEVYGELKPSVTEIRNSSMRRWESGRVALRNDVVLYALGAQGRIRGRKRGKRRPTLVLLDDIEDALSIKKSPKLPETNYEWLRRDVMYRLDKRSGKVRLIGNMLGNNCTVARVQLSSEWKGIAYTALDENGKSIWEEEFSTEFLLNERQKAEENGELDIWLKERMNVTDQMQTNDMSGYKLYEGEIYRHNDNSYLETNIYDKPILIKQAVGIDPEKFTENPEPRAFIHCCKGWMFDNETGMWRLMTFFHDQLYKQFKISKYVDQVAEWHRRYILDAVAIETNSLQVVFRENIEDYMETDQFYRSYPFMLPEVVNSMNKITRILRMQGRFNRGFIGVNSRMGYFIKEIARFSKGYSDGYHCLDAAEMADRVCPTPERPELYGHLTNSVAKWVNGYGNSQSRPNINVIGANALGTMLGRK